VAEQEQTGDGGVFHRFTGFGDRGPTATLGTPVPKTV